VLNNYVHTQNTLSDNSQLSAIVLTQLGNPNLQPEKGIEWEGGFDASFLENERIHTEVTLYHKYTRNAIIQLNLAPSYGADNLGQAINLGNVENRGLEVSVSAKLFDTPWLGWDVTVAGSKNSNKLLHKAEALSENGPLNTQFHEGYPVYGYWGLPVTSYADQNGDGILEQTELQFGQQKYLGAPYPSSDITYHSTVALWNSAVLVSANFDQINSQTTQLLLPSAGGNFYPRAAVDRTAPLGRQAAYLQAVANNGAYLGTSSSVRLNELSVTYAVPSHAAQRWLHVASLGITLAGRNLALWSTYAGKDPNVDTSGLFGEATQDNALGTPQPRIWTLRFNLGL